MQESSDEKQGGPEQENNDSVDDEDADIGGIVGAWLGLGSWPGTRTLDGMDSPCSDGLGAGCLGGWNVDVLPP